MTGWLIYGEEDVKKNQSYIDLYMEEGRKSGIKIQLILAGKLEIGIRDRTWFVTYGHEAVTKPDFAICRTIYPLLTKQLEYLGIPAFNNSRVAGLCNDKAKTCQYVAQLGIDMVDSVFIRGKELREAMDRIEGRSVIKAVAGHGGSQVFLFDPIASTSVEREEILKGVGHSDAIIQPFTGTGRQDLRVYVIGRKIIAAILRTAREGFKSNYSLGGKVERYELSEEEVLTVKKIISIFDFGLAGIDFLIGDKGELIFNEIEDVVGARMLYECTDINLAGLYLSYIASKLTAQEYINNK